MRHFETSQCEQFLDAFGENVFTSNGSFFKAILETLPFLIEGANMIQGEETYLSTKIENIQDIGAVLTIKNTDYVVYNVIDDLSGMIDIYYRTQEGQSFAEDY